MRWRPRTDSNRREAKRPIRSIGTRPSAIEPAPDHELLGRRHGAGGGSESVGFVGTGAGVTSLPLARILEPVA
jgi:hypothetical protein